MMAELSKKLNDMFMDECEGVKDYAALSKQMKEEHPDKAYAQIFKDMANEEKVHRDHIRSIIADMGADFTDDMAKAEEESDKAYKSLFC